MNLFGVAVAGAEGGQGILKRLSIVGANDRPIGWIDVVNYALSCKKGVVQKSSVSLMAGSYPDAKYAL